MTTIVKVTDSFTAIDQNGNDITDTIPFISRKRAHKTGSALRMVTTTTGRTQWRDADMSEYDALLSNAIPTKVVDNVKIEM